MDFPKQWQALSAWVFRLSYAELECKSNFSFLRGASHPAELIEQAAAIGLTAIALTDYDGVYGIPKAYWEKKKHPQLKLITGTSLNLEQHPRLTLLASRRSGYGLLCRILSKSHEGKSKGQAVLSWKELQFFFQDPRSSEIFVLASSDAKLAQLRELIPTDRLYLALQRHLDGMDDARTEKSLWLSKRFQIPIVASNDVHYHIPQRRSLQDALVALRELEPLQKIGNKLFSNGERYLKSAAQMQRLFHDLPCAIDNTLKIADYCTFCPSELRYRYPSEWIPQQHTAQSYLTEITWQGAKERYNEIPDEVKKQLHHELSLIDQLGFADYFLTIYDIVIFARSRNILCQGRGSAANSAVCYCLGITAIDPVRMQLLFERFISAERNEPPDIDVDFESERREEILQYVYEKYGRDRAAMISAVVTYQSRSAFRELSKALGVEVGTLSAKKLEREFQAYAKNAQATDPLTKAKALAKEINGFPRHLSIHSGGFTLSADPIIEIVPVEPASMPGRTIIQWDKYDLDFLGLLKIDLLSLGMLSAIQRTLKLLNMQLHEIPSEDRATYQMIQRGDTVGTFQIESRAQISMLGRLQPKNFYDLVVEIAIMRPGPIVGKMVHPYLRRRRGEESAIYPHPKLKEILGRTLGIPLFQEQVMKMAIELAGFTPGEADELRRAIGAWRSHGSIEKSGKRLMNGLLRSGLSREYAEATFQQIQGFAQYGFPESHAASFALLAYASSYLKCHHPTEFLCGLINSQPMGFYAIHTLIDDAKRHGVQINAVDPNHSEWESKVQSGKLQLGWHIVRGMHQKDANAIVSRAPYQSFDEFLNNHIRRDVLIRIAMADAFACFGMDQRQALWRILATEAQSRNKQGELFFHINYQMPKSHSVFQPLSDFEKIHEQYEAYSLSTHGHPMQAIRSLMPTARHNTKSAKRENSGRKIQITGLILVRQKPPTAYGMCFATLEDEFGFLDIAITPNLWEKVKETFLMNCFLEIHGQLQRDGNSFSLLASKILPIFAKTNEEEFTKIEVRQYFQ